VTAPCVSGLRRWGLLDRVAAAGTPATRRLRFDVGALVLDGRYPRWDGIDALYGPRRTALDQILIDAARDADADARQDFLADELTWAEGRVTRIVGRGRRGARVGEKGLLVVGADGKRSWALAGDAGLVLDPVSAHGISNAFRDAELLARAIVTGLGGGNSQHGGLDAALAGYHQQRDAAALPSYELTAKVARLRRPGTGERLLYASLAGRPRRDQPLLRCISLQGALIPLAAPAPCPAGGLADSVCDVPACAGQYRQARRASR
jgi:2-polyprenyl-6-methoxyphenol hydroxylase-like FAD-dependent oxidoreductase